MENKTIGEIIVSINASQINLSSQGPVVYFDTGSVLNGHFDQPTIYATLSDAPSRARRLAEPGDCVISTVRPNMHHFGFLKTIPTNAVFSTGFVVVHPDKNFVEPYYLYLLLTNPTITALLQQIAETSTTTYPSFKPDDIKRLNVKLPPLSSQKKIVEIIQNIDQTLSLNHQINQNLLKLCRLEFDKIKLTCSNTTELSTIAHLEMGQSPSGDTYNLHGEGTPLLNGAADFRGGIHPLKYTTDPKKVTQPGDYIFGVRATIGLTTKVFNKYAIGRGVGLVRALEPEWD
ncbi:restriction endonuclease subunit S [Oenococcus sicerae]|uniref:restriction endonuclease subunit S n=1 Tax=Oenococcus sicerae TaxID=2203724 RepID=UPI00265B3528|nr:restriction endonuclease subunit S [Oenococcus sicerae]